MKGKKKIVWKQRWKINENVRQEHLLWRWKVKVLAWTFLLSFEKRVTSLNRGKRKRNVKSQCWEKCYGWEKWKSLFHNMIVTCWVTNNLFRSQLSHLLNNIWLVNSLNSSHKRSIRLGWLRIWLGLLLL
jgi:hypothetical protein